MEETHKRGFLPLWVIIVLTVTAISLAASAYVVNRTSRPVLSPVSSLPSAAAQAFPTESPGVQVDNSQGQYYVKFSLDGIQRTLLSSGQILTATTHTNGIVRSIHIEASPPGQASLAGESASINIYLPPNQRSNTNYTGDFAYGGASTPEYEGTCTITVTENTGSTGNLKGTGICGALSDVRKTTSRTKTLTALEFNVKMIGESHGIE